MTELFASALHLDRAAVKALKMTDAYSLHRVVYSLFSDERSETEKHSHIQSGIVYADQGGDFQSRKVLIVSDRQPATQVDDQYGKVISNPISDSFLSHSRYRFKVQVNPVRKDKQSGKRIAVKGRSDIAAWFLQRAANSWGFEVDPQTLQVDAIEVLQFQDKVGRQVTLGNAHIQGQLTVTDPLQFHNSFKNGIGKGRAFGCGLLQIVPIIDNPFA
ncbi:type I-E CRISPR-associated protein Cas6/Cse3/CasE [Dickeya dianthicola]|uniref:type I-E CRISPR-associated protein Cas6/Cse3/CasE n=1 Tax=Dickeya dianthicola TaxID=204039 RepID=UPI0003A799D5|nr:type I-E CRISPR-associated protein Cas6/Cse3/CasE [Dickeya dianthicola]ATO34358.1 CRISPR-associated protein, Cse3 family [Dickeya dianthicola RNS04.9]MCA7002743.1 type I-E CRISPR-associated protein Cas6/Cse3/CasE [Dickeya dianthicola]MCI4155417.1 type I-E CRISPR-associated protein Cas6/Cse3/CasE [Dickeya dianthicola]